MKWFKKLFKKKSNKPNYDYRVLEKKDANGCTYYTAEVIKYGQPYFAGTYSTAGFGQSFRRYRADMKVSFLYPESSGARIRFLCPETAKKVCVDHLREINNLDYCKVVYAEKVNAKDDTNNC